MASIGQVVKAHMEYSRHLFDMKSQKQVTEGECCVKKFIACLELFKGLFESLLFCPKVEMLLALITGPTIYKAHIKALTRWLGWTVKSP